MGPLRETALFATMLVVTFVSFGVYFDGLERLHDLEANLWAVAVLFGGGYALFSGAVQSVLGALVVVLLYGCRTRLL